MGFISTDDTLPDQLTAFEPGCNTGNSPLILLLAVNTPV